MATWSPRIAGLCSEPEPAIGGRLAKQRGTGILPVIPCGISWQIARFHGQDARATFENPHFASPSWWGLADSEFGSQVGSIIVVSNPRAELRVLFFSSAAKRLFVSAMQREASCIAKIIGVSQPPAFDFRPLASHFFTAGSAASCFTMGEMMSRRANKTTPATMSNPTTR